MAACHCGLLLAHTLLEDHQTCGNTGMFRTTKQISACSVNCFYWLGTTHSKVALAKGFRLPLAIASLRKKSGVEQKLKQEVFIPLPAVFLFTPLEKVINLKLNKNSPSETSSFPQHTCILLSLQHKTNSEWLLVLPLVPYKNMLYCNSI